jgi:hypothetical protein
MARMAHVHVRFTLCTIGTNTQQFVGNVSVIYRIDEPIADMIKKDTEDVKRLFTKVATLESQVNSNS